MELAGHPCYFYNRNHDLNQRLTAIPLTFLPKYQVPPRPRSGSDRHHSSPSPPPGRFSFPRPSGRNGEKSGRHAIAANVSQSLLAFWARGFHPILSCPDRNLRGPTEGLHEDVFSLPLLRQ